MKVASSIISSSSSLTCSHKLNYFLLHHQKPNHNHIRIVFSLLSFYDTSSVNNKRPMVTSSTFSSSNNSSDAFTTLKEKVTFEREIKKSKFIAIAAPVSDERSAHSFLSQVRETRATHNCWAYKIGDQYRSNDDGEPSGTAGKPIHSAIVSSGLDRLMVVVIRYFGGIKLGTGGLVRAYGGVATECLRNAPTCLVKSKVAMGLEVPYDLLGVLYHQICSYNLFKLRTLSRIMIPKKMVLQWSPSKLILTRPRVWKKLSKITVAGSLCSTGIDTDLGGQPGDFWFCVPWIGGQRECYLVGKNNLYPIEVGTLYAINH